MCFLGPLQEALVDLVPARRTIWTSKRGPLELPLMLHRIPPGEKGSYHQENTKLRPRCYDPYASLSSRVIQNLSFVTIPLARWGAKYTGTVCRVWVASSVEETLCRLALAPSAQVGAPMLSACSHSPTSATISSSWRIASKAESLPNQSRHSPLRGRSTPSTSGTRRRYADLPAHRLLR